MTTDPSENGTSLSNPMFSTTTPYGHLTTQEGTIVGENKTDVKHLISTHAIIGEHKNFLLYLFYMYMTALYHEYRYLLKNSIIKLLNKQV